MKVLMLSWEYPPRIVGGISRVVYDLAQKLSELDNEVHVVTCWENGTKELEKDNKVFVHRVYTFDLQAYNFVDWVMQLNFSLIERCNRIISSLGNFDIIHAHDWIVAFAARTLKYSYSIPLISTIHATEHGRNWGLHNDTQRYISSVEWWLTYESWKVIVNSEYMFNEVKNVFQLPDDKLVVIHNGVNVNKFKNYDRDYDFRRKYALDNEKIVLFVGRLVNEKGVHVLIDAIPKVIHYYNDTKFIIVGKGPEFDHLNRKTWDMNIPHKVFFTGYLNDDDLLRLYKCADVAVFPSLYEPFGIVALEAMLGNVPVVVSETGGLGGIVDHGIDGMKSYTGNANSLADSILEILHNPDKAAEMKINAFEKVNSMYNWDVISRNIVDVYNSVVNEAKTQNWKLPDIKEQIENL